MAFRANEAIATGEKEALSYLVPKGLSGAEHDKVRELYT